MGLANGRRHYQCPQCKNKSLFERFSIKSGIYLPHRDALWEMNEFSDFYGFHGEFKIAFAFDFNKNFVEKIRLGSNSFFPYGTYFPSS